MKNTLKLLLIAFGLFCLLDLSAANEQQQPKKKKNDRPMVDVVQKDGKQKQRRCFKDANKDGYCDNGSEQQWKCPNNCRRADMPLKDEDKKKTPLKRKDKDEKKEKATPKTSLPCTSCPYAGQCHAECLTGLLNLH